MCGTSLKSRPPFFLLSVLVCLLWIGQSPAHARANLIGGWPEFAFALAGPVNVYWLPRNATFAYYSRGYYFRWQTGHWIESQDYDGPWQSHPRGFVLPSALDYGPPPPIGADRTYFVWWREHGAPWWRLHHPRWWQTHAAALKHYGLWQKRASHALRAHLRFWERSGGKTLHPDFIPRHPILRMNLPHQTIHTHDLSNRYYQSERNQYEWTHSWGTYGGSGNGGLYANPWNAYPIPWSAPATEGWYGNPWDPWGYSQSPWFQSFYGNFGFETHFPGDNQLFSPWMGNPAFAPWNGYPYNNP